MERSMKKKCSGRIALMLTGAMFLAGCGNTKVTDAGVSEVVVDMQQADVGSLTLQSSFVGTVSPQELVYVIPFASGTITEVNYGVGDYVNVGDVLFKIDDEGARMQLEQAQLSAASAKQQVDMATGSQQKSTDLQLESTKLQAQSGYEQAQIAYFQVKRSYEQIEDTVEKYEKQVKKLEEAIKSRNVETIVTEQAKMEVMLPQTSTSTSASGGSATFSASASGDSTTFSASASGDSTTSSALTSGDNTALSTPVSGDSTTSSALTSGDSTTFSTPASSAVDVDAIVQKAQVVLGKGQAQLATLKTQKDNLHDSLLQAESAYRVAEGALKISEDSVNLTQGEIRSDANAQAKTSLALAQLGVESAELALSYYTVTAPISGVIQSRSVEVNGIAGQQSPAFVIANENSMQVTFQVSESVKNTLRVGDAIVVERNGENFSGTVTEVGVAVNQQTGLFQVKANVNADGDELPTGVSVKLTADTYSINNVILIPYDAVYYDSTGAYVYLSVDNKAVKTYVTTDIFDDTTIAITEGISKGDTVITSWSPRLLDGVTVTASDAVGR